MSAGRESALFLEQPLEIIVPAPNKNQPAPSDQNRFDVARIEKLVASAMPNLCDPQMARPLSDLRQQCSSCGSPLCGLLMKTAIKAFPCSRIGPCIDIVPDRSDAKEQLF